MRTVCRTWTWLLPFSFLFPVFCPVSVMAADRPQWAGRTSSSNRCEVVCLDVDGLADGNDGPYTDESRHMVPTGELVARDDFGVGPDIIHGHEKLEAEN